MILTMLAAATATISAVEAFTNGVLLGIAVYTASRTGRPARTFKNAKKIKAN